MESLQDRQTTHQIDKRPVSLHPSCPEHVAIVSPVLVSTGLRASPPPPPPPGVNPIRYRSLGPTALDPPVASHTEIGGFTQRQKVASHTAEPRCNTERCSDDGDPRWGGFSVSTPGRRIPLGGGASSQRGDPPPLWPGFLIQHTYVDVFCVYRAAQRCHKTPPGQGYGAETTETPPGRSEIVPHYTWRELASSETNGCARRFPRARKHSVTHVSAEGLQHGRHEPRLCGRTVGRPSMPMRRPNSDSMSC